MPHRTWIAAQFPVSSARDRECALRCGLSARGSRALSAGSGDLSLVRFCVGTAWRCGLRPLWAEDVYRRVGGHAAAHTPPTTPEVEVCAVWRAAARGACWRCGTLGICSVHLPSGAGQHSVHRSSERPWAWALAPGPDPWAWRASAVWLMRPALRTTMKPFFGESTASS